jgi:hypothetical protein
VCPGRRSHSVGSVRTGGTWRPAAAWRPSPRAAPIRPDQRLGGPPAGERPRYGGVAPTAADGLAPGGFGPLRDLGGGGIARAQELAGEGEIGVGAGEVDGQALSLGLIDQVAIDIVPVVFGQGKPYFGTLANGHLVLEDPEVVIQGDGVLHLRYAVHRWR